MSEGRKAFAARLEGIQSGVECERLAPTLSAVVDGEAGTEDLAMLRPHLRTCLACRARLREYRAAPARVAAVAPPLAGGSLLASVRNLFDGAAGWISERSASLAVRWHQAAELAAAHKVAAVAASTAVLAGGGAATVATVDGGERPAAVRPTSGSAVVASPTALSGDRSATPRDSTATSGAATGQSAPKDETARADRDPAPTSPPADESSAPAPSAGEFTPDPPPAEPAATKPELLPSRAAGSEPEGGGEFSP